MSRKRQPKRFPKSGEASGAISIQLTADDLKRWADHAGLEIKCRRLAAVAEIMRDKIEWYPLWSLSQNNREAAAIRRDACRDLTDQVDALLFRLGLENEHGRHGASFRDCHSALNPALWDQAQKDSDAHLNGLARISRRIDQEAWDRLSQGGRTPALTEVFDTQYFERLAASLHALKILAQHASLRHHDAIRPGGVGRGAERDQLFLHLARLYRFTFGRLPTLSRTRRQDDPDSLRNAGKSWTFFRAMLLDLGDQVTAQLDRASIPLKEDERAQLEKLKELATAANGLAGEGDPLSHLLDEASRTIREAGSTAAKIS